MKIYLTVGFAIFSVGCQTFGSTELKCPDPSHIVCLDGFWTNSDGLFSSDETECGQENGTASNLIQVFAPTTYETNRSKFSSGKFANNFKPITDISCEYSTPDTSSSDVVVFTPTAPEATANFKTENAWTYRTSIHTAGGYWCSNSSNLNALQSCILTVP